MHLQKCAKRETNCIDWIVITDHLHPPLSLILSWLSRQPRPGGGGLPGAECGVPLRGNLQVGEAPQRMSITAATSSDSHSVLVLLCDLFVFTVERKIALPAFLIQAFKKKRMWK